MPDHRQHRGPHPQDRQLFAPSAWPALTRAIEHLSWLLSHHYAPASSLKLVGDHFGLDKRQRLAVQRSACSDASQQRRARHQVASSDFRGQVLDIDGFNVLTTLEAALAGGVLLRGRDGCLRDMASMHGSYRRVAETEPALRRWAPCWQPTNPLPACGGWIDLSPIAAESVSASPSWPGAKTGPGRPNWSPTRTPYSVNRITL